ncbi:MAG: molybdenum cofactor biosynthesis protein MoaE [Alphaproteobacteria bacterium]|nr:MAG: molybdenum cofactor biosynthesis protein MoaE [Alphaproteobacteria bacterium]
MVLLTDQPLDSQVAINAVLTDADGAYVLFVGTTRNHARGRSVTGLEYDAYKPLAESQMAQIVAAVQERWGLACAILHRTGYVAVGEASVVIAVASPHRAEAFAACQWAIDTLKADVPIWKKEYAADGTYWIEGDASLPAQKEAAA